MSRLAEKGADAGRQREPGIDLLRLLAMFFVILLHSLGRGGVLEGAEPGSGMFRAAWALETLALCGVDVFALISGYVSWSEEPRRTKLSSWLLLWLQVVFYGLAVALLFRLLLPHHTTAAGLLPMLLPVKNGLYWYFTAYTGLILIKPVLDLGLRAMPDRTARLLFAAIILGFSVYEALFQRFVLNGGYSFAWIALLYLMGGIVKKCRLGQRLRTRTAILLIALLWAVSWLWRLYGDALPGPRAGVLVSYVSPSMLGSAVLALVLFSRLKTGPSAAKIIGFAAPGAFAAYLINTHRDMWAYGLAFRFTYLLKRPVIVMVVTVVGFSLAFLIASVLIDRLRQMLFRLLRLREAAQWAEERIRRCVGRVMELF